MIEDVINWLIKRGFELKIIKKILVFFIFTCVTGLIITSVSAQEVSIPAWIKNNAGWWADGQIPEKTLVKGIENLV